MLNKISQEQRMPAYEKMHNGRVVMPSQKAKPPRTLKHMVSSMSQSLTTSQSGEILLFVIKVAALESLRRFSKTRCPSLWRFVQAFQVLSYPPFKWLQRWGPLRLIVRGAQKVSRPLLFLSIATAFSDDSDIIHRVKDDKVDELQPTPESLCGSSTSDNLQSGESSKDIVPDNWLLQLFAELEKQGVSLPERFNEDELRRFYAAANCDLACLTSSLVKTIRWRESYHIFSLEEIKVWSHLVFWHGIDVMLQPCLIIRLGLACSTLSSHDRPHFAQAIVSQIDHGISNLTDEKVSQITVLMDCDGLSPFRFPMNMLRSCAILLQDHFPNRLGTLFILRLPPIVRVLTQTFIQVLRPATRKKLRILGETNQKYLSEILGTIPAFLGGDCECSRCRLVLSSNASSLIKEIDKGKSIENAINDLPVTELSSYSGCDHLLRAAIIFILMLWVLVVFLSGMHDPDAP